MAICDLGPVKTRPFFPVELTNYTVTFGAKIYKLFIFGDLVLLRK